jgi:23S rRNA pseudouridine2605 synthase
MRINKWLAQNTNLSRRKADEVVAIGRVTINGHEAAPGSDVVENDIVKVDGKVIAPINDMHITIALHKPVGYVTSKRGQGSNTIYELLPPELHHLNPIGRLDKDSSGIILMSSDGNLVQNLGHPSNNHKKVYIVTLDRELLPKNEILLKQGVDIGDNKPSKLGLTQLTVDRLTWEVTLTEGRNRQIRRSFASVGNRVLTLNRTKFSHYSIDDIRPGAYKDLKI